MQATASSGQIREAIYNKKRIAGKSKILKDYLCKGQYLKIGEHGVYPHQLSAGVEQHPNGTAYCTDGYKERPENQKASGGLIPRMLFHFVFPHSK